MTDAAKTTNKKKLQEASVVDDKLPSAEEINRRFKSGGMINLLSDAGFARNKVKIQRQLQIVCVVLLAVSLVFGIIGVGFNYYQQRRLENAKSQLAEAKQNLEQLEPLFILVSEYQTRLNEIRKLEGFDQNQFAYIISEMEEVDAGSNSDLITYSYEANSLDASYVVNSPEDLNGLFEIFKEKEVNGEWSGLVISRVSSSKVDADYEINTGINTTIIEEKNGGN